jgi:type VI secretion system FHA domain protein
MPLALRVLSHHGHAMGANGVRVFEAGGSIGRTADNDWMLPDPERFVSSQHALISHEAGRYFLTDRSTNGTAVNGREVPRGGRVELRAGDRLTIGTYEIGVSIEQPRVMAPPTPQAFPPRYEPFSASDPFFDPSPVVSPGNDPTLDPLVALGAGAPRRSAPPPPQTQDDHASAESEFFAPPRVLPDPTPRRAPTEIPENWDETGFSAPEPAPMAKVPPGPAQVDQFPPVDWADSAPTPAPPARTPQTPTPPVTPSPTRATGGDVAALLAAAGVDASKVDAATLATLGEVLRVVVEGLMRTLKARAETKNQFRVAMTTLKPIDNNPLKFSADVDDALANLFTRRNKTFQTPVDAFRDAFEDLRDHQLAMMAGMRAAFTAVMGRFDPGQLQEAFDRGVKRNALLDVMNKTKYWDLYREMFESLGDDDAKFKRLFGDEFAEAYEEQMQRLASLRRKR